MLFLRKLSDSNDICIKSVQVYFGVCGNRFYKQYKETLSGFKNRNKNHTHTERLARILSVLLSEFSKSITNKLSIISITEVPTLLWSLLIPKLTTSKDL